MEQPLLADNLTSRYGWIEVRRGTGSIRLSTLAPGEFVTASGLCDGGYIVWRKPTNSKQEISGEGPIPSDQSSESKSVDKNAS